LHIPTKLREFAQSKGFAFALGHLWAQGLFFLTLPIINRVYSANAVADWTILQSLCLLLWSFSAFKTDLSMVQAEDKKERNDLFFFGLTAHILVCCVLFFLLKTELISLKIRHLWLIFFGLCAFGVQQLYCSRLLAQRYFRKLFVLRIVTAVLIYPGSLLLQNQWSSNGLLIAWTLGNLIPAAVLAWVDKRNWQTNLTDWPKIKLAARHIYQKYGNVLTLGSLDGFLTSSASHLFLLFLSWYYSSATLIAYFVVMRFISAPVSLLAAGVGSLNYVRFQDLHAQKQLTTEPVFAFWKQWWGISLLYYGGLVALGGYFFPWYQANHATEAPQLLVPMAIFAFFQTLTSPISSIFYVFRRMEYPTILNLFTVLRLALAWWMMYKGYPLLTTVWVFTAIALVHLFLYNLLQIRLLQKT
jgi:O-antigen/teichoic acid export membrane protein